MRSLRRDPDTAIVLVDSEGQVLASTQIDPEATRELVSLRGHPDVDAVLAGNAGSDRALAGANREELLVTFAPIRSAGWGVLVKQPAAVALAAARADAAWSVGLLFAALTFSFFMAFVLSSRLARSYEQLDIVRRDAERGRKRWAFVAECSRELATTLDYDATLRTVARLAVPALADWCAVELMAKGSRGSPSLAVVHTDSAKEPLARLLHERYSACFAAAIGADSVLHTGEPLLLAEVPATLPEERVCATECRRLLQELAPRSAIVVPIRASIGGTLGTMTLVGAGSGRRGPDDIALVVELAQRAVLAIENARLHAEVQRAVQTRDEFLAAA